MSAGRTNGIIAAAPVTAVFTVPSVIIFITGWIGKSTVLNRFYIETRYPADIPANITREFADTVLNDTEQLVDLVCDRIKFDYNSYHKRTKK